MKFYFQKAPEKDYCRARLLSDENDELFYFQVPKDDIRFWLIGFLKMMKIENHREQFQHLLLLIHQLHVYDENSLPPPFYRIMLALLRFLEHPESKLLNRDNCRDAQQYIRRFLKQNQKFNFRALYEGNSYQYGLIINGKTFPYKHIEELGLPCIPQMWWTHLIFELHKQDMANLRETVINYELLREVVSQQSGLSNNLDDNSFTLHSFASFSKALIEFLDQASDFVVLRRKIPDLCTCIVENEYDSFEEQKHYLERILKSEEAPIAKIRRLNRIVQDVEEDAQHDPTGNQPRLTAIVGAISDYYLSQYDLDQAAHFWKLLKKRDRLLHSILSFYRWPRRYAVGAIVFTALASLAIVSDWFPDGTTLTNLIIVSDWIPTGTTLHTILSWLSMGLVLLSFVPAILALVTIIWRFFTRRGLDYIELFLPRLLGAIVVGLSVLLLQDTSWDIGLNLDLFNFVLVCLVAYALSFVYIFIDVHKTLRHIHFLPQQNTNSKNANSMGRSIKVSSKIFLIGSLEAFIAVLFTSVLFSWIVLPLSIKANTSALITLSQINIASTTIILQEYNTEGLILQIKGICSFGFFPELLLVWTGLSLFIGAFVQLIWQDRRITSPL